MPAMEGVVFGTVGADAARLAVRDFVGALWCHGQVEGLDNDGILLSDRDGQGRLDKDAVLLGRRALVVAHPDDHRPVAPLHAQPRENRAPVEWPGHIF